MARIHLLQSFIADTLHKTVTAVATDGWCLTRSVAMALNYRILFRAALNHIPDR
jgi:hypothetical protein